jgi:ribosomal protein S18 acetylase RimI-like enzyme
MEFVLATTDHIPILTTCFTRYAEQRRLQYSHYLTHPGLTEFHLRRMIQDIESGGKRQPWMALEESELVGYAKISPSSWHTQHFGVPCYKFAPLLLFQDQLDHAVPFVEGILATIDRDDESLYSLRLDAQDHALAYALSRKGFIHLGTSIRMIHDVKSHTKVDSSQSNQYDSITIREFDRADLPALRSLIKRSHTHSHFFRELRFPLERSKELFADWIQKCAEGIAETILIAEENGHILGFCSLLANTSLIPYIHQRIGIIDFIAVDESAQGKGIGKRLLEAVFSQSHDKDWIELRTMADNIGAIGFYQKNGFRILSSDPYYHYWT